MARTNDVSKAFAPARTLIVAVWFGKLPAWMPLWLRSCELNPDFDWLLVTDDGQLAPPDVPANVHVRNLTMDQFAAKISDFAGSEVAFVSPYKVCDFRPLFSCLLDLVDGQWDFWGHCDIDMLFGRLGRFCTPELLFDHDRIFGVGHFSIYRNSEMSNNMFRQGTDRLKYLDVLADPEHRAFDEHLGVNKIWLATGGRFFQDESIIADIDPNRGRMVALAKPTWARQAFAFEDGCVRRYFLDSKKRVENDEFMYVHFQKRGFDASVRTSDSGSYWLTPNGFEPKDAGPVSEDDLIRMNDRPVVANVGELRYVLRRKARAAIGWASRR